MSISDILGPARDAFERQAWGEAYTQLSEAARQNDLAPDDRELLATAAYLLGRDAEAAENWARAHRDFQNDDRTEAAARCAFWLGFVLLNQGEHVRGSGWISRARRHLEDHSTDCAVQGFVLLPTALEQLSKGHSSRAYQTFSRAGEIAKRFGNRDLIILARLGRGQSLIRMGDFEEGIVLLDEAMVAVEAGDLSPIVTGIVYCGAIETCHEIFDLRRAEEWTAALTRWCESHPELIPFRGQCLTRRAEILQVRGAWEDAMGEARKATAMLAEPRGEPAAGAAFYRQGELYRLEGKFPRAEHAYRRASQWGRDPQPGLALLRLVQGQVEDAKGAIQRLYDEVRDRRRRSRILPAYVEIMLEAGEVAPARAAADELSEIVGDFERPYLNAVAARAEGAVQLAEGAVQSALRQLRHSLSVFGEIGTPYESARVRELIGRACQASGDSDTAEMEFEAARETFEQLHAAPDLTRVERLIRAQVPSDAAHGLTSRELEVLRQLATGKTNREIGRVLFISERTVDRHVSKIFAKLDVSSRAAATAYAYEHGFA